MAAEVVAQTGLELFNGLGLELRQSFVQIQARAFVLHTRDEVMIRVLRLAPRRSGPSKLGTRSSFSGSRLSPLLQLSLCVCVYVCMCVRASARILHFSATLLRLRKKRRRRRTQCSTS